MSHKTRKFVVTFAKAPADGESDHHLAEGLHAMLSHDASPLKRYGFVGAQEVAPGPVPSDADDED